MKLLKLALPVLACTGIALMAQDNGPIEEWMKTTNASVQALRKMEKKTGPEAVAHAEKSRPLTRIWSGSGSSVTLTTQ